MEIEIFLSYIKFLCCHLFVIILAHVMSCCTSFGICLLWPQHSTPCAVLTICWASPGLTCGLQYFWLIWVSGLPASALFNALFFCSVFHGINFLYFIFYFLPLLVPFVSQLSWPMLILTYWWLHLSFWSLSYLYNLITYAIYKIVLLVFCLFPYTHIHLPYSEVVNPFFGIFILFFC